MSSKISVIIPFYKTEAFASQCIESVISSSYQSLEIILVDDGSPDRCGEICDAYQARDARIHVIHQHNQGLSAARNAGIDLASGDYIAFVDSDDYIEPDMYATLLTTAQQFDADIVLCGHIRHQANVTPSLPSFDAKDAAQVYSRDAFLSLFFDRLSSDANTNMTTFCNKLFKKSLFDNVRFPVGRCFEDESIICRVLYRAEQIVEIPHVFYHYIIRADSIVSTETISSIIDKDNAFLDRTHFFDQVQSPFVRDAAKVYFYYCTNAITAIYRRQQECLPEARMLVDLIKSTASTYMPYIKWHERISVLLLLSGNGKIERWLAENNFVALGFIYRLYAKLRH